jgi:hypothetical protein
MRCYGLALLFFLACGGRVEGPADEDAGSSHSSEGGSSADVFPVCPAEPPTVGAACASPNQGCRYVTIGGGCAAYACDGTWRNAPEGC